MKYLSTLSLYMCTLLVAQTQAQCPTETTVRKEIHQLNDQELTNFLDAVVRLKSDGTYNRFVENHVNNFPYAHSTPGFFPWHRQFLRQFEIALQQIDSKLFVPYWDWSLDSQAPESSKVFQWFGGNGVGPKRCVVDGPFANWQIEIPERSCLRRTFNLQTKIAPFYAPEVINRIISDSETYEELREAIEGGPHGTVHMGVNGDMSRMGSPNDPLFWLHHSYVDKIWTEWQIAHPDHAQEYSGVNIHNKEDADVDDILPPFGIPVSAILDHRKLCYEYSSTPSSDISRSINPSSHPQRRGLQHASTAMLRSASRRCNKNKLPRWYRSLDAPKPDDRTNQTKLRVPLPLPRSYLDMMGLDAKKVRRQERRLARYLEKLNKEDYLSPVSLARQNCTLAKLVQDVKAMDSPMIFSTVAPKFPLSEYTDELESLHPALDPSVEKYLHDNINPDEIISITLPMDTTTEQEYQPTSIEIVHETPTETLNDGHAEESSNILEPTRHENWIPDKNRSCHKKNPKFTAIRENPPEVGMSVKDNSQSSNYEPNLSAPPVNSNLEGPYEPLKFTPDNSYEKSTYEIGVESEEKMLSSTSESPYLFPKSTSSAVPSDTLKKDTSTTVKVTPGEAKGYYTKESENKLFSNSHSNIGDIFKNSLENTLKSSSSKTLESKENLPETYSLSESSLAKSAPQNLLTNSKSNRSTAAPKEVLAINETEGRAIPTAGFPQAISDSHKVSIEETKEVISSNPSMKGSSITKERPDHLSNSSAHTLVPEKTMGIEEKQPVSQSDSLAPIPTSEAPLPPTMPDLISFPLMNNLQGDMVPLVGGSQLIEPATPIIGDKPMEQYIIDDSVADFESNSKAPTLKDSLLPNSENV